MIDQTPDLPRVVLCGSRRTPDRKLAELATPAGLVVPGAAQIAEAVPPSLHEGPAGLFRVANSLFDILVRMARSSGHIASWNDREFDLVVK
ncbi:MAG: hypothetical protein ABJL55_07670 [Roseibium sp.]